jgi:hypothetical protein
MYARAVLPLVPIVAYFGVQSENFAKPIGGLLSPALPLPPATGSIQLTICDFAEISCPFQTTQVQFPPDQVTKKIVKGSSSAAATMCRLFLLLLRYPLAYLDTLHRKTM